MIDSELKNKTARGLFWGGMSGSIQQLLNLVFGIFLARLLSPGDYGMVGMLTIFTAIAGSLQDSGFSAALINRKDDGDNELVWSSVFWFNIVVSALLYVILFCCAPLLAKFYRTPELTKLARFLFLSFFISSFGCVQSAIFAKHLMIKQKAIAIIFAQLISGIVGIVLAYEGFAYWGLATQSVIYILCFQIMLWIMSPWRPSFCFSIKPIKEIFPFSFKLLITNIFTNINNNVFSVILGRIYTKQEVGDYTQANKWNAMCYGLVSGMVSSVSQPVLAKINEDKGRQLRIFRKLVRFTAFISFPALFGLALVSPEFISIAITDKWAESSFILRILCVGAAFIPLAQLFSSLLISNGKSDIFMISAIVFGTLQIIVLLSLKSFGIRAMVFAYSGINVIWLFVWHQLVKHHIGYRLTHMLEDILPYFLISAVIMLTTYMLTRNISNIYFLFFSKLFIASILYFCVMKFFNAEILGELWNFLKGTIRKP